MTEPGDQDKKTPDCTGKNPNVGDSIGVNSEKAGLKSAYCIYLDFLTKVISIGILILVHSLETPFLSRNKSRIIFSNSLYKSE